MVSFYTLWKQKSRGFLEVWKETSGIKWIQNRVQRLKVSGIDRICYGLEQILNSSTVYLTIVLFIFKEQFRMFFIISSVPEATWNNLKRAEMVSVCSRKTLVKINGFFGILSFRLFLWILLWIFYITLNSVLL